ncbi:TPA: hypothetical protein N0F65_002083 [Lagenidium giganteum]|uniref:CBF1-interacting co-repressor CIR N-terminal domain-containing protein n=1 Tax=Lagenidium giganteum TaxID=4803 RepID=A0AAV2ZDF6_9STRA|nr:TPA: hypothetical protein N0F65_002083 [Lagenidium giganteum]
MGGGGLRILGHKKWHVWRRDNIDRVERDEREEEERKKKQRDAVRRVEQERRVQELQRHADAPQEATHINFFQEEQDKAASLLVDKPSSSRKRPTSDFRDDKVPWYSRPADSGVRENERKRSKRQRALNAEDPLILMRPTKADVRNPPDTRSDHSETSKHHKTKKHKHKHKKTKRSSSDDVDSVMAKLRAEREAREAKERARAQAVIHH